MINGFGDLTYKLTNYEKIKLLPRMIEGLRKRHGKDDAATNKKIVSQLRSEGYKISDVRVRKIINYIRINGLVKALVASSKGYYVATDVNDIETYIQSLRQREDAIAAMREAITQDLLELTKSNLSNNGD